MFTLFFDDLNSRVLFINWRLLLGIKQIREVRGEPERPFVRIDAKQNRTRLYFSLIQPLSDTVASFQSANPFFVNPTINSMECLPKEVALVLNGRKGKFQDVHFERIALGLDHAGRQLLKARKNRIHFFWTQLFARGGHPTGAVAFDGQSKRIRVCRLVALLCPRCRNWTTLRLKKFRISFLSSHYFPTNFSVKANSCNISVIEK